MNKIWSDMLVCVGRVVFRGIITQVFLSGLIVKFEVLLSFPIKQPEVPHFHGSGVLAFDGIVDNADGGRVVDVNRCWWLWVSEFGKSETEDFGLLCIEEEGTQFGFGGGSSDKFEYSTCDVDGAVEFDRVAVNGETTKEEVGTGMAPCLRGGEIRRIGVDVEYHVQGALLYDGVGVHPNVIKKLLDPFLGVLGWRRLLSGNVKQGHEYGWVDCSGIVVKTSNNLLDALLAGVVQEGTVICWIGRLIVLAISNWVWCKRAMLGFERRGVSITGELFHDVFGHDKVNISLGVVPFEADATVEATGTVLNYVISFSPKGVVDVLQGVLANVLDPKVVHC